MIIWKECKFCCLSSDHKFINIGLCKLQIKKYEHGHENMNFSSLFNRYKMLKVLKTPG